MKTINSKSKITTNVLRTFELDTKTKLTIEKITSGELEGQYTIKSQSKKLFSFRNSTLAAYNIETDFNGNKVVKIEYAVFRMLKQAISFAKSVKKNRYNSNLYS